MDLSELRSALRRHALSALAAAVVVVLLGAAAAFLPAKRYSATATILVQPNPDKAELGSVQVVATITPALPARIGSKSFYVQVKQQVPSSVAAAPVSLGGNGDAGTGLLTVTARSTSRTSAAGRP